MAFINIFFVSFFCSLSLLGGGKIFNKLFLKQEELNFFENLIFGCIFFSSISLFINFFFSLNQTINLIFIIIPFFLYFFINKSEIKNDVKYLLFISFLTVIFISFENTNRPDAGLYHLPYIGILNDSNLIVGLSNIHFRYGHTSIIQYLSASYNNIFFSDNGILVPPAIIFFALLGYLINEFFKKSDDTVYKFFVIVLSSYVLINMNRYSSWGNDDFASIIMFIIFLECYKNFLRFNLLSYSKILILCSYAFFIKSFYALIFLLPIVLFYKNFSNYKSRLIFNSLNFFNFTFICFWLIKNFLVSSCLIFPVSFLCFDLFAWSINSIAIENISIISEAWAKDWINKDVDMIYSLFNKNFNWLQSWINNHFFIVIKNISILVILVIIFRYFFKIELNKSQKKFINSYFLVFIILFVVWFLKFPLLRYGEGIIVIFLLLFSFYIKIDIKKRNSYKFSTIFILILCFGILLKNFSRIYSNYDNYYVDYPWPKKNSYTDSNSKNEYNIFKNGDKFLYYEPKIASRLCMYGSSPCAATEVNQYYFKMQKIQIDKGKFLFFDMFFLTNKNK